MENIIGQIQDLPYTIGFIFGTIFGMAIRVVIYSLFLALLLRTSTRMVAGFRPKFSTAYKVSFAGLLLSGIVLIAVRMAILSGIITPGSFPPYLQTPLAKSMLNLAIVIVVCGVFFGLLLSGDGKRAGLIKGLIISMLNMVFIAAIVGGIFFLSKYPLEMILKVLFLI